MKMRYLLSLLIGSTILAGCYSESSSESFSESFAARARANNQAARERAIYSLAHADSLNAFLRVEANNWKLGASSLDVNVISENRRLWYVTNKPDLSPDMKKIILAGKWQIGMT